METTIKIAIYIHAFFGGIGLLAGFGSVIFKKGSRNHKQSGKLFSIGMIISSLISLPICWLPKHENIFLFLIGIFTIYLVLSGNRVLGFRRKSKADFTDKVSAGINGSFSDYGVDGVAEAWNMPAIKIGANLEVAITDKISAGTDLFFAGERKDIQQFSSLVGETGVRTLESYFDANIHVNYKFSERLNFFLRGNNLANKNY